jgi:hypothetical protein
MGIFLGESQLGFLNVSSNPERRASGIGAQVLVTSEIRLNVLNSPMRILIAGTAWIPQGDARTEIDFKVHSGTHDLRFAAFIENGMMNADIYTAGERMPLQVPVSKDLLMTGSFGTIMNVPALSPGKEVTIDAFDPMTLSVGKAKIKCIGEETISAAGVNVDTKVITTDVNGMTSKAWVTNEEEVVQVETPFGFSMRKIRPEEAIVPGPQGDTSDLLKNVAIQPSGKTPFRGAKRMKISVTNVNSQPPEDNVQTAEGNIFNILCPNAPNEGQPEEGMAEYLGGDAFVQTEHEKIKEIAASIVQDEPDVWKRALKVHEWVYKNIVKKSTFSIPSALEVLETREGDCNEHTVLYTALARAANIPTRIAIGIVWSDTLNGFYYHAWPEVHINGKWIYMDPTLGQVVADATHFKLLNGNIEAWPRLIPYIGQIKIDVMEIE